jgi:shikimate kinase / 3-dehydroquinate synthase
VRNIVLTGFMGTGKTTVGRAVAGRLSLEFVDTDELIAALAQKPIADIFSTDGEAAFRRMEHQVCRQLSTKQNLVIATGGGTLIDPANRRILEQSSLIVCLTATHQQIATRLRPADIAARPLLAERKEQGIYDLLKARQAHYDSFQYQIDTTTLSIQEVEDRVLEIAKELTLTVDYPGGSYPIQIANKLLSSLGQVLSQRLPVHSTVAIVANTITEKLYADIAKQSLAGAGFKASVCTIPDGEQHKTLATVEKLYRDLLDAGVDRRGCIVSLGGGVTGDIAGFAAASFMRGVQFVQVPTTLLAMLDASVGGKTGVNLPHGKNLVGAFKFPVLVLIDTSLLETLPYSQIKNGAAEAIKHGIIDDPDLFATLSQGPVPFKPELVARVLRTKIEIVQEDPYENGRRLFLNLGHTVGHAIEKVTEYSIPHGEAVSMGIVAAVRIAIGLKEAHIDLLEHITSALASWDLPVTIPAIDVDEIMQAMIHDKKSVNGKLSYVIPRGIGRVEVTNDVTDELFHYVLSAMKGA